MEKDKLNVDENLEFYDFTKMETAKLTKNCYLVLENFREKENKYPQSWNVTDMKKFLEMYIKEIGGDKLE